MVVAAQKLGTVRQRQVSMSRRGVMPHSPPGLGCGREGIDAGFREWVTAPLTLGLTTAGGVQGSGRGFMPHSSQAFGCSGRGDWRVMPPPL